MAVFQYEARDLFDWLTAKKDMVVVDVRNAGDFARFKVEAPVPFRMFNIPYFDFMEFEKESIARLPEGGSIRIVCSKEASAKYVADMVHRHGFTDVGYLKGGIPAWGNLLVPRPAGRGSGYELYQFIRPGKASCSYGLIASDEIMLFDPSRNTDFYLAFAAEKGCRVTKTFETHLQADYIAGSRTIAERTGAEFLACEEDFRDARLDYTSLEEGRDYGFGPSGPEIKAIFTPGHTPGSTTFIIDEKYMISGDTVFIRSVGRPDLGGKADAWAEMLFTTMNSMKRLDPGLVVLPGHFIDWNEADPELVFRCSLGDALERNRAIYDIARVDQFIAFIKDNMRPQPEEYARIRRINANLEQADEEEQDVLDIGKNECAASAYAKARTG
jgi:glyoxylase-like metal-dependent hydrolase (beta-lactamase superfamily II)